VQFQQWVRVFILLRTVAITSQRDRRVFDVYSKSKALLTVNILSINRKYSTVLFLVFMHISRVLVAVDVFKATLSSLTKKNCLGEMVVFRARAFETVKQNCETSTTCHVFPVNV
jgi:hypothetical protein